jgi:hypothetical protein
MLNNKNTYPCRGKARLTQTLGAHRRVASRRLCVRAHPARRAWRTHAYRDSQVIFYGHDLPSEFLGRRR